MSATGTRPVKRIVGRVFVEAGVEHDVAQAADQQRVAVGSAAIAALVPTMVPPPGRFSTTKDCLSRG